MNKTRSIKTSRTHFSWNCLNKWTKSRFEVDVTSYGPNKNLSSQVLTCNSKNFHWLNNILHVERTMSELRKPFLKKWHKRAKIKVRMPHVNKKPLARNGNLVQTESRPRMNYEWTGKTLEKNPIAHVNKKPLARKRNFVQTPFSHST